MEEYCVRCGRPESCCWCGDEAELITDEEKEERDRKIEEA